MSLPIFYIRNPRRIGNLKILSKGLVILLFLGIKGCFQSDTKKFDYFDCRNLVVDSCHQSSKEISSLDTDEAAACKRAVEFYVWYCQNRLDLNQDSLVFYDDAQERFAFNNRHSQWYLARFDAIGMVSQSFIDKLKREFSEFEAYLSEEKLGRDIEGVGFEADIIFNSQDPNCYYEGSAVEIIKFERYKNRIRIEFSVPGIYVELVKSDSDGWLVDYFS